jgi:hypothetical protein
MSLFLIRYENSRASLGSQDAVEVHEKMKWMEKKIASFHNQEILYQSQLNSCSSSSGASHDPVPRHVPTDSCAHVLDKLMSAMSQVCDNNPRGSDVDLVTLSREVCSRMNVVPLIVQHLLFHDRDEYLTRLVLDSVSKDVIPDLDAERQRLMRGLLFLEVHLVPVEERMCKLLHSIGKQKGCWLREVTRLLSEVQNNSCKSKVPGPQVGFQRTGVAIKEAVRLLDFVQIDSSITAEDELDSHLRLLEQKIRTH